MKKITSSQLEKINGGGFPWDWLGVTNTGNLKKKSETFQVRGSVFNRFLRKR